MTELQFGDLKSDEGLKKLDDHLIDKIYIFGHEISKSDLEIFKQLGEAPAGDLPNARRWYNHIKWYTPEKLKFLRLSVRPRTREKRLQEVDLSSSRASVMNTPRCKNLKSKDFEELNTYLTYRTYIIGHEISKSDLAIFKQLGEAPAGHLPHALRWYNHIKWYTPEKLKSLGLSGGACPLKANAAPTTANDDDDDVDLFGSDEGKAKEAARTREKRPQEYKDKKAKKPRIEVDVDGLIWGASKLVPVGYGIKKLQIISEKDHPWIICVIEDAKVSVDELAGKIKEFEDFVQSVDIAAFNKI